MGGECGRNPETWRKKKKKGSTLQKPPNSIPLPLHPPRVRICSWKEGRGQTQENWRAENCNSPRNPVRLPPSSTSYLDGLDPQKYVKNKQTHFTPPGGSSWVRAALHSAEPLTPFPSPDPCLPPDIVWRAERSLLQIQT